MKFILETERLILREFMLSDAKFIVELVNTPGWIEYIGDRNIKTEEQAKTYLETGPIKSHRLNGFGLSLVELKDEKNPIGMCGIHKRDQLDHPDLGFAFLPDYMGKGYALEMARATLDFAKEQLKINILFAITVPFNKRSIKLLEKVGMKFNMTFCLPDGKEDLMLFSN